MSVTSEKIKLEGARLSFPVIWVPKIFTEGQSAKFQATFLLDPSNKAHAAMIRDIKIQAKKIVTEQFGEIPTGLKKCFGMADKHPKKKDYEGYEDMFYISTSNTQRPTLVDRHKDEVFEKDGILYAGCYVTTVITLWCQDHPQGGKGVNANLRIIQFEKDGEAFGRAPASADEELDDLPDDDSGVDDDWDDDDDELD